jgi:hypothetical protein
LEEGSVGEDDVGGGLQQFVRDRSDLVLGGQVLEDEAELVASEAANGIQRAQDGLNALADLQQNFVASLLAESAVEVLEVVEIHQHEGNLAADAGRLGESLSELLLQMGPVAQACQRVIAGHGSRRLMGLAAVRCLPGSMPRGVSAFRWRLRLRLVFSMAQSAGQGSRVDRAVGQ